MAYHHPGEAHESSLFGGKGSRTRCEIILQVERFGDTRIEPCAVKHVRAVIREEHLQPGLHIRFGSLIRKSAADEGQRTVSDKTADFLLRQPRQIELLTDVIDRCGQILFRIDQRSIEIKNENGPHEQIITGSE